MFDSNILIEIRNQMKSILKEDYNEIIKPGKDLIKNIMTEKQISEIEAMILITQTTIYNNDNYMRVLLSSAVVDVIEEKLTKF